MSERDALKSEIIAYGYLRPHRDRDGYVIDRDGTDFRGHCEQGLPIPPKRLWIGYGSTDEEHLESGRRHVTRMLEVVRATGFEPFEPGNRLLDFGCGELLPVSRTPGLGVLVGSEVHHGTTQIVYAGVQA